MAKIEARAESEFERLVARGLTDAGFRIQMQGWVQLPDSCPQKTQGSHSISPYAKA
jgi:hypothetical protein